MSGDHGVTWRCGGISEVLEKTLQAVLPERLDRRRVWRHTAAFYVPPGEALGPRGHTHAIPFLGGLSTSQSPPLI